MINSINDNADNIISYEELSKLIWTFIVPYKKVLIYDGLLNELGIKSGK